jgi:hypothetical protein
MKDAGIDVLPLAKGVRVAGYEGLSVVDNPADVVGDPSSGVGGVGTALKGHDNQARSPPPCLGCRAHPAGVTTYYNEPLFGHDDLLDGNTLTVGRGTRQAGIA